jgi:type IV pilus assembly protein PilX
MKSFAQRSRFDQRGMVLVSSLLLLLVVTIMALSMFRSFGMQERIAGNVREKQRALQVALTTQQYAEWWLVNLSNAPRAVQGGVAQDAGVQCANTLLDANQQQGQICENSLVSLLGSGTNPTTWPTLALAGTSTAGVMYTPTNYNYKDTSTNTVTTNFANIADVYINRPRFYVQDVGTLATGRGEIYQIDAYSFGESANTVAVVESTVALICLVCNLGGV